MKIAHYEVTGRLGAGGMGEVYRATDPKLRRDVAIKVLPAAFLQDPERRARFEREAHVLASINHPHIGTIYGVEDADGGRALVLELIEGETLDQRVTAAGRLSWDEALSIARQIAEALEAAHEKGIVHRDLKPANIMLSDAGAVKVVDFGLARVGGASVSDSELVNSPTLTAAGTVAGTILGTAIYLSPEQARGRVADKRTDIWAFGCVLYEMLTGRSAFGRETVPDSIAAILHQEPDWTQLPPDVPERVRNLLRRCLAKDPKRRLHDIADARIEIEDALAPGQAAAGASPTGAASRASARTGAGLIPWLVAALSTLAVVVIAAIAWKRGEAADPADAAAVKFTVVPPGVISFTPAANFMAFSPDGRHLAFIANNASGLPWVFIRSMDSLEVRQLSGTEGARQPFWSPDSREVGFFAPGGIVRKVALNGGPPQTLSSGAGVTPTGATWNADGLILVSLVSGPIRKISGSGGTAAVDVGPFDQSKQPLAHSFPWFLPDGSRFLYYLRSANPEFDGIYLRDLRSGQERLLVRASSNVVYTRTGHILYVRDGVLLAHPFDASSGTLGGEPIPVAEGIDSYAESGIAAFSASQTGALVYRAASAAPLSRLVWFDRAGKRLEEVGEPASYRNPRLSPDRKKIAVERTDSTGNRDIWIVDLARNAATVRFSFGPGRDASPVWSSDGQRIVWQGANATLIKSADGRGGEQQLHPEPWIPDDWLPDGSGLLLHPGAPRQVFLLNPASRSLQKVLERRGITTHARISPDGKWIAYANADSGRFEVVIQDFPGLSGRWDVSAAGGLQPKWRSDGKELFYISLEGRLTVVPVSLGSLVEVGRPQPLFQTQSDTVTGFTWHQYDVSTDGQRFLVTTSEVVTTPVTVVYGWPALLRDRR